MALNISNFERKLLQSQPPQSKVKSGHHPFLRAKAPRRKVWERHLIFALPWRLCAFARVIMGVRGLCDR